MSDDAQNPGLDMGALFEQAQQMGEQLMAAQAEAAATVVEGHSGGGAVKIEVTGAGEFVSVSIAPGAVNADDVEMLEDLVLAALHDATRKMGEIAGAGGGLDLGGIDLGGLGLGGLMAGDDE